MKEYMFMQRQVWYIHLYHKIWFLLKKEMGKFPYGMEDAYSREGEIFICNWRRLILRNTENIQRFNYWNRKTIKNICTPLPGFFWKRCYWFVPHVSTDSQQKQMPAVSSRPAPTNKSVGCWRESAIMLPRPIRVLHTTISVIDTDWKC